MPSGFGTMGPLVTDGVRMFFVFSDLAGTDGGLAWCPVGGCGGLPSYLLSGASFTGPLAIGGGKVVFTTTDQTIAFAR